MKLLKLLLVALLGCHLGAAAQEYDGRHGWPEQKAPEKVIVCPLGQTPAEAHAGRVALGTGRTGRQ